MVTENEFKKMDITDENAKPCEEEPCKSRRAAYARSVDGQLRAQHWVWLWCGLYKTLVNYFFTLLGLLVLAFAAYIICQTIYAVPFICGGLYGAIMTITVALGVATICILVVKAVLIKAQRDCRNEEFVGRMLFLKIHLDCPVECWVPEVKIDCGCK